MVLVEKVCALLTDLLPSYRCFLLLNVNFLPVVPLFLLLTALGVNGGKYGPPALLALQLALTTLDSCSGEWYSAVRTDDGRWYSKLKCDDDCDSDRGRFVVVVADNCG